MTMADNSVILRDQDVGMPLLEWSRQLFELSRKCDSFLNERNGLSEEQFIASDHILREGQPPFRSLLLSERELLVVEIFDSDVLPKMQSTLTRLSFSDALPLDEKIRVIGRAASAESFRALSSANYWRLRGEGLSDAEIDDMAEQALRGDLS